MSVYTNINFNISGQVDGEDNTKEILEAELNLICAKYGLELKEVFE